MPVSSATEARVLVYNIVVAWLAPRVGLPASKINVGRTFRDPPPSGYSQTTGAYMSMCDHVADRLQETTGRAITLPVNWRIKYEGATIAAYINAVSVRLLSSQMNATGKSALNWAFSS
jgi:hypothetical protein